MFSGLESPRHLLIVLVIAVIVLGPKKLPEVGRSLGAGIRGFKASLEGEEKDNAEKAGPGEKAANPEREPVTYAAKTDDR